MRLSQNKEQLIFMAALCLFAAALLITPVMIYARNDPGSGGTVSGPGTGGNQGGGNSDGNSDNGGSGSGGSDSGSDSGGSGGGNQGGTSGGGNTGGGSDTGSEDKDSNDENEEGEDGAHPGGDGAGGGYEPPPGPSPSEIARENAQNARLEAADKAMAASAAEREMKDEIDKVEKNSAGNTTNTGNSRTSTTTIGDPVLASTGSYLLETEDYGIPGSDFTIGRKYISEEETAGSMGSAWLLSFDSRIIRGVTPVNETRLKEMEALASGILAAYERIDQQYAADIAAEVYSGIYLPVKAKLWTLPH